ncbi:MAG: hypothetical protein CMJ18_09715 [Phycisphaeraceae bacterium]|nr:hypothetical protein [Phycisphaeraceae bacterium]
MRRRGGHEDLPAVASKLELLPPEFPLGERGLQHPVDVDHHHGIDVARHALEQPVEFGAGRGGRRETKDGGEQSERGAVHS